MAIWKTGYEVWCFGARIPAWKFTKETNSEFADLHTARAVGNIAARCTFQELYLDIVNDLETVHYDQGEYNRNRNRFK